MKPNLIFYIFIINFIYIKTRITEIQKIRVRACMKLQSRKYQLEEEKVTHFLEHMSKEMNAEPRQVLYISLSICSKIIPDKLARIIHDTSGELNLNLNNTLISKIYNFEYYNLDDIEFIKTAYKEFLPVFEVVREELKKQKEFYNGDFQLEFFHSPLFRLFFIYFIINTIIIFYRRIKFPPKIINVIKKEEKKDKEEKNENEKEKEEENKEEKEERKEEKNNKKKKSHKKKVD